MFEVGLHFIVGIQSTALYEKERAMLQQLRPAGVILFKKNISKEASWRQQLKQLRKEIGEAVGRKVMLFGVDHEGGRVFRFHQDVTKHQAARCWGTDVAAVAQTMGLELRSLGFNTGFTPVLDVDSESTNPVIGERAFSSDPLVCAERGAQFIKVLESHGVLACAKHFPGHGATTADSHETLPIVLDSKEVLLTREVIPFVKAIAAGIQLIMTAHVCYPALDPDCPATLSKKIIEGLLRSDLGYRGVVISDDLQMKALLNISHADLGVQSLQAGVDLLLVGNVLEEFPVARALAIAAGIAAGIERGILDKRELEKSTARVLGLLGYLEQLSHR